MKTTFISINKLLAKFLWHIVEEYKALHYYTETFLVWLIVLIITFSLMFVPSFRLKKSLNFARNKLYNPSVLTGYVNWFFVLYY